MSESGMARRHGTISDGLVRTPKPSQFSTQKQPKQWYVSRPYGALGRHLPPMVRHDGAPVALWRVGWANMVAVPDADNESFALIWKWRHGGAATMASWRPVWRPERTMAVRRGPPGPAARSWGWQLW